MRVFKFGGASVKNAEAVSNIKNILQKEKGDLIIIISAMDKTTNKLEKVWQHYIQKEINLALAELERIILFHQAIYKKLDLSKNLSFVQHFNDLNDELKIYLSHFSNNNNAYHYDQIVSYGELWSTWIISNFLQKNDVLNSWLDARKLIRTSSHHQEGRVNWGESKKNIQQVIKEGVKCYVSQGFIGFDENGTTTTLGREGSDYSAAIFAWSIDATEVVIWKDVTGLLNADPKIFKKTVQLKNISFKEAIELSYLGASVIHPKTIKPLQNKGIPLSIRSFLNTQLNGSWISENGGNDQDVPSYIYKPNQILLSISAKDYSFIFEDHISELFGIFSINGLKVHLMQNSALSFSICGYIKSPLIPNLIGELSEKYLVRYNEKVDLLTIRQYKDFELPELVAGQEILIEQRSRSTIRYVLKK